MVGVGGVLVSTGPFTQDPYPVGRTLFYSHHGFNKLMHLVILWTVRHRWPEVASFTFFKNLVLLILHQSGMTPDTLLIQYGVTQGYPLLILLYSITLITL